MAAAAATRKQTGWKLSRGELKSGKQVNWSTTGSNGLNTAVILVRCLKDRYEYHLVVDVLFVGSTRS